MRPYEAYLFDLDGTLLDSVGLIIESCRYSLMKVAGLEVDPELVRRYVGIPLKDQYPIYLQGRAPNIPMAQVLDLHMEYQLSIWRQHLRLFPQTVETLAGLKARGSKLAVVTSRRLPTTELYTQGMGIASYFDLLITPEATAKHKPDPEPAQVALRKLRVEPANALFIGDAVFDLKCGAGAGCDTAYVAWGYTPVAELDPQPGFVLNQLSELLG